MSDFVKVASLSDLGAGTCRTVEANGKSVALFNVAGTIYALDNTCLHRGGPLGDGMLEGDVITCPWHSWQYSVKTGENVRNSAVKVVTYPVRVQGNDIEVSV
jgi:nitrite reductase/ring-hydroxylating ferredoxin subunit